MFTDSQLRGNNPLFPLHIFINKIDTMPELIPGYNTEQKTVAVAANDTDINAAITAQAADGWIAGPPVITGSDAVILFTRTTAIEL